jgi:hypothetical protein
MKILNKKHEIISKVRKFKLRAIKKKILCEEYLWSALNFDSVEY